MMSGSMQPARLPATLPGFEGLARAWNNTHNLCMTKILPGEYYVTTHDEVITTVLGSCISACIRDPMTGTGGMNHFMLPGDTTKSLEKWGGVDASATRYGVAAMEKLINDILKQGARKSRLEVKLFGGGHVLDMKLNAVGQRNIQFARDFAATEGLTITSEDLGDVFPRKVNYFPKTGKVMVRRLRALQKRVIADTENQYANTLTKKSEPGDIELFG
ncbi:MAG: chemoreceptor glutamine deamidase CheD [Pseudomonadota bacterium]